MQSLLLLMGLLLLEMQKLLVLLVLGLILEIHGISLLPLRTRIEVTLIPDLLRLINRL